jgi:hypothetical protein
MDKIKFTLGKYSFPDFFATNCTYKFYNIMIYKSEIHFNIRYALILKENELNIFSDIRTTQIFRFMY